MSALPLDFAIKPCATTSNQTEALRSLFLKFFLNLHYGHRSADLSVDVADSTAV